MGSGFLVGVPLGLHMPGKFQVEIWMAQRILIVDHDARPRDALAAALKEMVYATSEAGADDFVATKEADVSESLRRLSTHKKARHLVGK